MSRLSPAPGQLEVMPDAECVKRLQSNDLGRIALVDREVRPVIFPVNYFFDEGVIVFRTGPGTKMDLAPGAYVCFEIDGWDPGTRVGWSVLAKGFARDITQPRGAPTGRMLFCRSDRSLRARASTGSVSGSVKSPGAGFGPRRSAGDHRGFRLRQARWRRWAVARTCAGSTITLRTSIATPTAK